MTPVTLWFPWGRTERHYVVTAYAEQDSLALCAVYGAGAYTLHAPDPEDADGRTQ